MRPSETKRHLLLSPYRCRTCRLRFWVLRRRARVMAAAASGVGAAIALGFGVAAIWPQADETLAQAPEGASIRDEAAVELPKELILPPPALAARER